MLCIYALSSFFYYFGSDSLLKISINCFPNIQKWYIPSLWIFYLFQSIYFGYSPLIFLTSKTEKCCIVKELRTRYKNENVQKEKTTAWRFVCNMKANPPCHWLLSNCQTIQRLGCVLSNSEFKEENISLWCMCAVS